MVNSLFKELFAHCMVAWRTIDRAAAGIGLIALFAWSFQAAQAQQEDAIEVGRLQFMNTCAVFHGQEGTGNGIMAPKLRQQPADLTRLSMNNGGTFPSSEAFAKIWGSSEEILTTHQMSDMPAFYIGPVFGRDEDFEDSAGRLSPDDIKKIIAFLETIQEQ